MNKKILLQLNAKVNSTLTLTKNFMSVLEQMDDVVIREYPKNTFLVPKYELNQNVFFIRKGCARSFVHDNDLNDITIWFSFEYQAIFSTTSYILQMPSEVMIQAIEDTEAIVVPKDKLEKMYITHHELNYLSRTIMETFLVLLSLRAISLQTTFAETRYHELMEQYPNIINRVPLRHIASFLGVKFETLSRIRANYKVR